MNKNMLMLYFPYGIRVVPGPYYKESFRVDCMNEDHYVALPCWKDKPPLVIPYDSKAYKLALYPLSALTLNLKINNREMMPLEFLYQIAFEDINILKSSNMFGWFKESLFRYFTGNGACPFSRDLMNRIYYVLYSLHFDLTGAIQKREAKNILKLDFDPYAADKILLP